MVCKPLLVIIGAVLVIAAAISVNNEKYHDVYNQNEFHEETEIEDNVEYGGGEGDREGKLLFPFVSIVRFANTDCASTNTMNGTCLARRECNNLNGTITGLCAARRGRCCIVSRSCGRVTNVNNTYFTSPGYPAAYAGGAACSLIVNRCNSNVCQLRIEFLDMVLAQPDGDGNCVTDSITITGGNTVVPIICGDNTGRTIFVNFDGNTAITITITATLATTFARRWNLRLIQLGCDCPGLAPNGCLQYFTGATGTITSFNFGNGASTVLSASLVTGTRQMVNLNYGICIRQEAGFCAIQYAQFNAIKGCIILGFGGHAIVRQLRARPSCGMRGGGGDGALWMLAGVGDAGRRENSALPASRAPTSIYQTGNAFSFTVTGDVEGADNTVLGTAVGALNDGACTTDFVVIPNPVVAATGVAVGTDRFCGLGFVSVQTATTPFVLYVVTDGNEGATAVSPPDVANRGFALTYTQIAC